MFIFYVVLNEKRRNNHTLRTFVITYYAGQHMKHFWSATRVRFHISERFLKFDVLFVPQVQLQHDRLPKSGRRNCKTKPPVKQLRHLTAVNDTKEWYISLGRIRLWIKSQQIYSLSVHYICLYVTITTRFLPVQWLPLSYTIRSVCKNLYSNLNRPV